MHTAELQYFRQALESFDGYAQYHLSANNDRRMNLLTLPREQRELLTKLGYRDKLDAVDEGIRRNSEFLDEVYASGNEPFMHEHAEAQAPQIVDLDMVEFQRRGGDSDEHAHSIQDHSHSHSHDDVHRQASRDISDTTGTEVTKLPPTKTTLTATQRTIQTLQAQADKQVALQKQSRRDQGMDKVRSTLRQLIRDWSEAGQPERDVCYRPCLEAVEAHFSKIPRKDRGSLKVLIPGAGLGRLALEFASRGFAAEANEISAHMLLTSHFILNVITTPQSHQIFPNLHSFSNHLTTSNSLLKSHLIPDVVPSSLLPQGSNLSFVAGDFDQVYGGSSPTGSWSLDRPERPSPPEDQAKAYAAVVTCFFIDTARNIISYLETIKGLLQKGGIWVNVGPLLWHWENTGRDKTTGEGSIELSLDEVKDLAREMGFVIQNEKLDRAMYTGDPESMLKSEYQVAFWTATLDES